MVVQVQLHKGLAALLSGVSLAASAAAVALLAQRRLPRVLDVTMAQWTLFLMAFMAIAVPALDREWRPILVPFELARRLEAGGARVYEGRLSETELGYASLTLQHVLPPVATPEAVDAALAAPEPAALLLEPSLYWKHDLRPRVDPALVVPLAAYQHKELWFRTPVLVLNRPARALLERTGP
jgi:hypothetical protein